jgi:hypothetical protein
LFNPDVSIPSEMSPKAEDFSIEYKWVEGSVPPPHHSEYTVRIGPGSRGEVVYLPDYPSFDPAVRRENFDVSDDLLSELYTLMEMKEVFSRDWPEMDEHPIGGSREHLAVTANGTRYLVPAFLVPEQAEAIREVYQAIRSAVPESIWSMLKAHQKEYEHRYHEINKLFDFLLTLGDHKAFDPKTLTSLTGIPLTIVPSAETKKFDRHESPDNCSNYNPYINKMELRVPHAVKNWVGLIILVLNNTLGITNRDVYSRFGEVSDLVIPDPNAPRSEPLYLAYHFEWGKISFGISRDESELLVKVIFDAYRRQSSEKTREQLRKDIPFALPDDAYITSTLPESNQVNFETRLSLEKIVDFYRQAFGEQGLTELELTRLIEPDVVSLSFEGLPECKIIVLQAVDLHQSSKRDIRNVNIRTERSRE